MAGRDTRGFGHEVATEGIAYARACPPEMYEVADGDDIIKVSFLVWYDETSQWSTPVSKMSGRKVREVIEEARRGNKRCFVARPNELAERRAVMVPPRHRALWIGETIRRGDEVVYDG